MQIFSYSSSSSETLTEKEDHNWACLCCCGCCCGLIVDLLFHFSSSFSLKSNFRSFSRSNFAPFDVSFCYQKNSSTNRKNFVLFMFSFSVKYLLVFLCRLFSSFHFCSKNNNREIKTMSFLVSSLYVDIFLPFQFLNWIICLLALSTNTFPVNFEKVDQH